MRLARHRYLSLLRIALHIVRLEAMGIHLQDIHMPLDREFASSLIVGQIIALERYRHRIARLQRMAQMRLHLARILYELPLLVGQSIGPCCPAIVLYIVKCLHTSIRIRMVGRRPGRPRQACQRHSRGQESAAILHQNISYPD